MPTPRLVTVRRQAPGRVDGRLYCAVDVGGIARFPDRAAVIVACGPAMHGQPPGAGAPDGEPPGAAAPARLAAEPVAGVAREAADDPL